MVISMKNIFGFNSSDENNLVMDGNCFVTRKVSESLGEHLDKASQNFTELEKKQYLPAGLGLLKTISLWLSIMIFVGILRADVSLSQAYENAPFLIISAPVLLLTFIVLKAFELFRRKNVNESTELAENISNTEELFALAKNELGVPEIYAEIDVLFTRYVIKNGNEKKKAFGLCSHYNQSYMMFVDNANLCISNMYERVDIPLSSLRSAVLSDKLRERASFSNWNKPEAYNSDTYKKYKITLNNQGSYFCSFYTVEICDSMGDFCLLIPSYDFEKFSQLTGVRTAEN